MLKFSKFHQYLTHEIILYIFIHTERKGNHQQKKYINFIHYSSILTIHFTVLLLSIKCTRKNGEKEIDDFYDAKKKNVIVCRSNVIFL